MINKQTNTESSKMKKLSNDLIIGILEYLKPNIIGKCLTLNKAINSSLNNYFPIYNISVSNIDNVIIFKKELKQEGEIKNVRISVKIKQEHNHKILLMLELQKNEKERLGVIPLLFRSAQQSYITNINSYKYSSVYFWMKSGNMESMKFKVELVSRSIPSITVEEITISILSYNIRR